MLRCPHWLHFVVLPAAGVAPAGLLPALVPLGFALVTAAGALAWAYGLNAVVDRATDSAHKNPLAGAPGVGRMTWMFLGAAVATALASAAMLGPRGVTAACVSLAAGTLYSAGPRAKARPITGLAMNTLIFVPLCALPTGLIGARPAFALLLSSFATLLVENQLVHELADADEDGRSGARTTAIALGVGRTRAMIGAAATVGTVLAFWVSPEFGSAAQAAALVLGGAVVATVGDPGRARRRHRWFALAGGAFLWLFVP